MFSYEMAVGYHFGYFGYQSDMDHKFFWWTTKLFILMDRLPTKA